MATIIWNGAPVDELDEPTLPHLERARFARGTQTEKPFGPYRVCERLGEGGMGQVHRAEIDGADGVTRSVALKRLRPALATKRPVVEAFVKEAELACRLDHPNIARTISHGVLGDTYYIEMEYVDGQTLWRLLQRTIATGEPVPIPMIVSILIQLCDALDHVHELADEHGQPLAVVHRDVSPSNIIVSPNGTAKLIDFGIAKSRVSVRTQSGVVKGKLAYLAPEYLAGHVDRRVDLFALGAIAYELITGRLLFHGANDFKTVVRVRELPINPPSHYRPEISAELEDIVLTALSRDPATRWQSAAAMRNALRREAEQITSVRSEWSVLIEGETTELEPGPPTTTTIAMRRPIATQERGRWVRRVVLTTAAVAAAAWGILLVA